MLLSIRIIPNEKYQKTFVRASIIDANSLERSFFSLRAGIERERESFPNVLVREEGSGGWKIIPGKPPPLSLLYKFLPFGSIARVEPVPIAASFSFSWRANHGRFLSFSPDSRSVGFHRFRVCIRGQGARYFRPSPTRNAVPGGVFRTGMVDGGRPPLPRFVYTERRNRVLA